MCVGAADNSQVIAVIIAIDLLNPSGATILGLIASSLKWKFGFVKPLFGEIAQTRHATTRGADDLSVSLHQLTQSSQFGTNPELPYAPAPSY